MEKKTKYLQLTTLLREKILSGELKPGEKEMLNIVLPAKAFASFLEEQQEWRIQAGAYGIWIGNSLSEAKLSAGVKVSSV